MHGDGVLQRPHDSCANCNHASTNCPSDLDRPRGGFGNAIRLVERKTCVQFLVSCGGDSRRVCDGGKEDAAATNSIDRVPVQDEACRRCLKRYWWTCYGRPCVPNREGSWNVGILNGSAVAS